MTFPYVPAPAFAAPCANAGTKQSFWMSFWDFLMHLRIWKTFSIFRTETWASPKISARRSLTLKRSKLPVKINPTVSLDRMSLNSAVWQTSPSSDFTAVWARMAVFRQLLIFWASVTPVPTLLEMHSPWTRV